MKIVGRSVREFNLLPVIERRDVVEHWILSRWVSRFRELLQALPPEFRIVVITVTVRELLIVSASHGGLVVFFGQPGAPVEGVGGLISPGIKSKLFVEFFLGFVVASLAKCQPGRFPMRVRGAGTGGKALWHFP